MDAKRGITGVIIHGVGHGFEGVSEHAYDQETGILFYMFPLFITLPLNLIL
jgi:hypothetical protein